MEKIAENVCNMLQALFIVKEFKVFIATVIFFFLKFVKYNVNNL